MKPPFELAYDKEIIGNLNLSIANLLVDCLSLPIWMGPGCCFFGTPVLLMAHSWHHTYVM